MVWALVCQEMVMERAPLMEVGCFWRIFLAMVCLVEEMLELMEVLAMVKKSWRRGSGAACDRPQRRRQ